MKKIVIVVVVLVLALVIAPWGVGKVAEKRLNVGLDKLVEQAPYFTIVERKWTGGWFKSEQVVTLEIFSAWVDAMNPKKLEEALKKEGEREAAEAAAAEANAGEEPAGEPAVAAAPDAVPPEEAAESSTPTDEPKRLRFTIRNDVWHGPVLGLTGFGIARVNTHFVFSDETRKEIAEIFGPKDPFEISTRIGFTGGGTTTLTSEGRTLKPKGEKVEVTWETLKVSIGYSRDGDKYDLDGKWPKIEAKGTEDKTNFVMTGMTLDGAGKRIKGDLYDTDFKFAVDNIGILGADGERIDVAGVHYMVDTDTKGDFLEMIAKVGTGEIKSKQLSAVGIQLKEIHYDFSFRRLHIETLTKIMEDLKAAYAKPVATELELTKLFIEPFKEKGAELLKYDPEFSIDRIGIVTPEGDGYLKGVVTLKGATKDDFVADNPAALIGKVNADFTIDVSEKMVQKFPNGSSAAGMAVDTGYVERKGERLVCKILFKDGALTINGKPQAIPGLGGPPPVASEEGVRPAE